MNVKRCFRYFRPGDLAGLERALNEQSRLGWQAEQPGRFVQRYRRGAGVFVHRVACCPEKGEAGRITWLAAIERAGWEPGPQRRGWTVFRKSAELAADGEQLPMGRAGAEALFQKRISRLETLRRWMLVLAAALIITGYASALRPVSVSSVAPLLAVLFFSYRIKFMEEGVKK